ncbi:L-asparaginase [mine drainage metagenome]|uniref:L-asparaginase n=1 Tax=mine drainage metagenome TaxID=410659 RepID=A0A1J5PUH5_9ZZZZ
MNSENKLKKLVVLGTGGTIAGIAKRASDNIGYTAGQLGVAALLEMVPGMSDVLKGHTLHSEQVAQVDSKDMRFDIWLALAQRVVYFLQQPEVTAVVITHGTDTVEETAFFLQSVLPPALINSKPVVLACAMRPASALNPDGPQNLMDAATVALADQVCGVVVVCAGVAHAATDVQKAQTYRLDAFTSGDAGPLCYVEEGQIRQLKNWPQMRSEYAKVTIENIAKLSSWPRVEIVMSYAGCSAEVVDALLLAQSHGTPLRGLVVAATGSGTIHQALEVALRRAVQNGVKVVRSSRCIFGKVFSAGPAEFAHFNGLSPVKTRIALMLELMQS